MSTSFLQGFYHSYFVWETVRPFDSNGEILVAKEFKILIILVEQALQNQVQIMSHVSEESSNCPRNVHKWDS